MDANIVKPCRRGLTDGAFTSVIYSYICASVAAGFACHPPVSSLRQQLRSQRQLMQPAWRAAAVTLARWAAGQPGRPFRVLVRQQAGRGLTGAPPCSCLTTAASH